MAKERKQSKFWTRMESYTDVQRTNAMSMRSHALIVTILQILALMKTITGAGSVLEFVVSTVVGFAPIIVEFSLYKKDPQNRIQQHFVGYGFALYYTVVLFTGTASTIFAVAIPMMVMIMIFNDVSYTFKINFGLIIETIIISILMVKTGKFGFDTVDAVVIQNLVVITLAFYSVWTAKTIDINEKQKIKKIEALMKNTEDSIADIYKDINALSESSEDTKLAMGQVTVGATETANAVATQMEQTHVIRQKTEDVAGATQSMNVKIHEVLQCVQEGSSNMTELLERVDDSVETSKNVENRLAELTQNMSEMNGIVKMISDIAFQTNLLALNANVEAAHAGEAGRGFAVVATEVAEMSIRTKDATEQIGQMIENVSNSMNEMTGAITKMIEEINSERESAGKTGESFQMIERNTGDMSDNAKVLLDNLEQLTEANKGIVNSIETISAASEEVSALADNAQDQEVKNSEVLSGIADKMQILVENM